MVHVCVSAACNKYKLPVIIRLNSGRAACHNSLAIGRHPPRGLSDAGWYNLRNGTAERTVIGRN